MLSKPATLRDVASRARVHPSTASRALNVRTRDLVNPATVDRVLGAAEDLGYQPNSLARGLKMSRTFTIGMLIPDLTNPLFPPIVRGLEDRLGDDGYTVIIANSDGDEARERAVVDTMKQRRVDGLILATARRDYPVLDEVLASRIPVVLINRTADARAVPSVTGDDEAGVGMAVRHLIDLGHTRIAHVAGPQSVSTGLARYRGFLSALEARKIDVDARLVVFSDWFREVPGASACSELLRRTRDFTAVVAANDLIALGCYDVLKEEGWRIPDDVSIVGYNDVPFSDKFDPPLSTVRIPHYEIGVKAAELVLAAIDEPDTTPTVLRLAPHFVRRCSTAEPGTPTRSTP